MNLDRYYSTLGLPSTANLEEVKRAYRRLSFQYHPDKNPGYEAKFIEIKTAYEIIIGKQKINSTTESKSSTQQHTTHHTKSSNPEDLKRERVYAAQQRYKQQQQREYENDLRFYNKIITSKQYKFAKFLALFCFAFASLLVIDYVLIDTESVIQKRNSIILDADVYTALRNDLEKTLSADSVDYLLTNGIIEFNKTNAPISETIYSPIFNKKHIYKYVNREGEIRLENMIKYDSLIGIILFLFVPILLWFYKKMTPLFTFLYYCSCYLILPLGLIIFGVHLYLLLVQ